MQEGLRELGLLSLEMRRKKGDALWSSTAKGEVQRRWSQMEVGSKRINK